MVIMWPIPLKWQWVCLEAQVIFPWRSFLGKKWCIMEFQIYLGLCFFGVQIYLFKFSASEIPWWLSCQILLRLKGRGLLNVILLCFLVCLWIVSCNQQAVELFFSPLMVKHNQLCQLSKLEQESHVLGTLSQFKLSFTAKVTPSKDKREQRGKEPQRVHCSLGF